MGPHTNVLVKPPSPLDFPRNFNPHAVAIWFASCSSLPQDPRSAWTTAITRYRAGCKSAGLSPFADQDLNVDNAIRNYLYAQRRVFVRAMNYTGLTSDLKILRLITREARVESYGFSLMVSAQFQMDDPTWISTLRHLRGGYRFNSVRDALRRYHMELDPGLSVYVWNTSTLNPRRWHIGYEIRCPISPSYKADTPLSVQDKESYILNELWAPLMNTYRPLRTDRIRHI